MNDLLESLHDPLVFLVVGYLFTVAIETPILCAGLSPEHPLSRRIFAGFWLTACSYPLVVLVVPYWLDPGGARCAYLLVAECTAHVGECALFYAAFTPKQRPMRDLAFVFGANLASFGSGEFIYFAAGMYR